MQPYLKIRCLFEPCTYTRVYTESRSQRVTRVVKPFMTSQFRDQEAEFNENGLYCLSTKGVDKIPKYGVKVSESRWDRCERLSRHQIKS